MGDIFDQYCEENGITREDPLFLIADKIRTTFRLYKQKHGQLVSSVAPFPFSSLTPVQPAKHEQAVLKKDMLDEVRSKIVPEDVITRVSATFSCVLLSLTELPSISCVPWMAPQRCGE